MMQELLGYSLKSMLGTEREPMNLSEGPRRRVGMPEEGVDAENSERSRYIVSLWKLSG
jgi:hypothetical protein